MKAVIPVVPEHVLEWRRRTGSDQWDEMWEGVLHMSPVPNREHQDLEGQLEMWIRQHWARPNGFKVYHQINLASPGGWPERNYRIPDLVLLTPERFHIDHNEYFEGAPAVVVEIRSTGDESYEKLPFYAELGVPEVWIIDRDTKQPEVHALMGDRYEIATVADDGWILSDATGIELRSADHNKIELRLTGNDASAETLPAD